MTRILSIALLSALALGSTVAFARDDDRRGDRDGHSSRGDQREYSRDGSHERNRDRRYERDSRGSHQQLPDASRGAASGSWQGGAVNPGRTGWHDDRRYHGSYGSGRSRDDHRGDRGGRDDDRYRHDRSRGDESHGYGRDHHRDRGRYDGYARHDRPWHDRDWRHDWSHGWSGHRYRAPARYVYPRGYAYRSWQIGLFLPSPYLASHYYLDYRNYRLAPPPYGCRWIRVDGDVLLVEVLTGEIVDALYSFFY